MTALTTYTCSVAAYTTFMAQYQAAVERRLQRVLKFSGSFQSLNKLELELERTAKANAVGWYDHFCHQLVNYVHEVEAGRTQLATIRTEVERTLFQMDQQIRELSAPPQVKTQPVVALPRKALRIDPMVLSAATAKQVHLAKSVRRTARA